ncbi:hypothetical protein CT19431_140032 [Cupriavidus taiwanensis]|nr:hypothetical protein CT19431_140032 [Cupriavidus taiwanensis]
MRGAAAGMPRIPALLRAEVARVLQGASRNNKWMRVLQASASAVHLHACHMSWSFSCRR